MHVCVYGKTNKKEEHVVKGRTVQLFGRYFSIINRLSLLFRIADETSLKATEKKKLNIQDVLIRRLLSLLMLLSLLLLLC